jgi:hypothetical protein
MSPRGTLVVAFMPLHGVFKCKMCLKHVKISYISAWQIFIFFGIFFYFPETKIYLFEELKIVFRNSNYIFLSSLGGKTFIGMFLEFLEVSIIF